MSKKFSNQIVWITGASSGIGAELAREFAKEGAIVALSARRLDRLNTLRTEIGEDKAFVYELDVQKKRQVSECAKKIASDLGGIDVVVANAGYSVLEKFEKINEKMWRNLFDTNVFGVVWTIQAALPYLKKSKGRVAIMSSVAGKLSFGLGSAYNASKFALMGIGNAILQEFHIHGVSVTNIAPGLVESEIGKVDNLGNYQEDRGKLFPKFTWRTDKAAKVMIKGIYYREREVVVTNHAKVASFLVAHFSPLTYWGLKKLAKKARHKKIAGQEI